VQATREMNVSLQRRIAANQCFDIERIAFTFLSKHYYAISCQKIAAPAMPRRTTVNRPVLVTITSLWQTLCTLPVMYMPKRITVLLA
jgi:hypothetical protein